LPDLPDLENVMDDREELKEFALQVGRDISEEELEEYFAEPAAEEPVAEETVADDAPTAEANTSTDALIPEEVADEDDKPAVQKENAE